MVGVSRLTSPTPVGVEAEAEAAGWAGLQGTLLKEDSLDSWVADSLVVDSQEVVMAEEVSRPSVSVRRCANPSAGVIAPYGGGFGGYQPPPGNAGGFGGNTPLTYRIHDADMLSSRLQPSRTRLRRPTRPVPRSRWRLSWRLLIFHTSPTGPCTNNPPLVKFRQLYNDTAMCFLLLSSIYLPTAPCLSVCCLFLCICSL